jgi:hypothetical protein
MQGWQSAYSGAREVPRELQQFRVADVPHMQPRRARTDRATARSAGGHEALLQATLRLATARFLAKGKILLSAAMGPAAPPYT